ncbi:hypothetical protein [Winogradskyella thalassocola]|uniref:Uncharacterized protein n=1 Tax=Winogradskyella thalassocola TaxID=262004 RepID=A0A1G7YYD4_9FLAO|nr:hypothetical protein [Winogradskyella thalassocola]SDH01286.1 hypothetical protein SAMN04489796_1011166 [Winogradskyella thalassocola]
MGTGLFIIDAIIIAIVILPFALFINGSKKRQRKLRNALQSEATQNNCKLSKTEVHSNFAIGLDEVEKKVFFYKETEDSAYAQVIDLKFIVSCKFIKDSKRIKDKTKHYDVIDKIQLSFEHQNLKEVTNFVLFNNDDEMALNNEIVIAQKWQDIINDLLEEKVKAVPSENEKQVVLA